GDLRADAVGNGVGGTISLTSSLGFVQVTGTGNLTANGSGTGKGGTVTVVSSQTLPFVMAASIPSGNGGIAGNVSANGGATSGGGGSVTIKSDNASSFTMS